MTIFAPIYNFYFKRLTARLARMGLTYHDAIAETGVYDKAISRLPPNMQVERQRRIKRAFDFSAKHTEMAPEVIEDPWREYKQVQTVFSETQKEVDERKFLSKQWWMPYHVGRETWHSYDTKTAWFWQTPKPRKEVGTGPAAKRLQ